MDYRRALILSYQQRLAISDVSFQNFIDEIYQIVAFDESQIELILFAMTPIIDGEPRPRYLIIRRGLDIMPLWVTPEHFPLIRQMADSVDLWQHMVAFRHQVRLRQWRYRFAEIVHAMAGGALATLPPEVSVAIIQMRQVPQNVLNTGQLYFVFTVHQYIEALEQLQVSRITILDKLCRYMVRPECQQLIE